MLDLNNILKSFCKRANVGWLVILGTLVILMIELLFYYLFIFLKLDHQSNLTIILPSDSLDRTFYLFILILKACVLAPIIETGIFQYFMFEIITIKLKVRVGVFIFLSAILFGLIHFNSFSTVIITSIIGLNFNYFYCILREINSKKMAYLIIAAIHSLVNLCVFVDQIY